MRRRTKQIFTFIAYFTLLTISLVIYKSKTTAMLNGNATTTTRPTERLKYILQWTSPRNMPFVYMGIGRKGFIYRNCTYTNCYVTSNKDFFNDITKFDVIAFSGPEVIVYKEHQFPTERALHQKYVFANVESAAYYPICRSSFNGFFNWTWTYRLDSDVRWGYIVVKDAHGKVVGPNKIMHWIRHNNMRPVTKKLKSILRGKTKAVAWMVSNCHSDSNRETYANDLNKILQIQYNLSVDIYGECGKLTCSKQSDTKCYKMIQKDYYFYLTFENSISEDYVTEKLLNAVQNYAVPIVYGGANYSRFLPGRSYLNAQELEPEEMAEEIYKLINSFEAYVEYFRWTNHYSYHKTSESAETDEYCNMCALLNDESKMKEISVYNDLKDWWDPPEALCYENDLNLAVDM